MPHDGAVTTAARGIWLRAAAVVAVLLAGVAAALTLDLPCGAAAKLAVIVGAVTAVFAASIGSANVTVNWAGP